MWRTLALELPVPSAHADANPCMVTWTLIVAAVVLGVLLLRDCIRGSRE